MIDLLQNIDFIAYKDLAMNKILEIGPQLLLAIIILYVGFKIINFTLNIWDKVMRKHKVDVSLRRFLRSLVAIGLKILVIISVLSTLGVQMTSFVAILGAAGLAVGLALKGSLSNLAGGVMIIFFKPFKVGDHILAQGHDGVVYSVQIFSTVLHSKDNQKIIIPNGDLSNGSIINFTAEKTRRVDFTFGIGYGDDLKKAKDLLLQMLKSDKRILEDPAPFVGVAELADSSVNFTVRGWCQTDDYWDIYFNMNEKVKLTFDKEGITIPYPQQDVHLHKVK